MAALARELAAVAQQLGLTWTVAQVREQLEDAKLTELADELLVKAQARRLLMVVDQFEELLTQTSSDTRARFTEVLNSTLGSPVHVVATLRPEFLNQLLVKAKLASTHTYTLQPLHAEALPFVIKKPAELAGIGVDDDLVTGWSPTLTVARRCRYWRSPWPSWPRASVAVISSQLRGTRSSAGCRVR
jgi:hypothetical protein